MWGQLTRPIRNSTRDNPEQNAGTIHVFNPEHLFVFEAPRRDNPEQNAGTIQPSTRAHLLRWGRWGMGGRVGGWKVTNERPKNRSCHLRANEKPQNKFHGEGTTCMHQDGHRNSMTDPAERAESMKIRRRWTIHKVTVFFWAFSYILKCGFGIWTRHVLPFDESVFSNNF